jgi:hypothetical protein
LLLLSLVACMAARSQLEVGRLKCGRPVGAEDVSDAGGLPIGQACMDGRASNSPAVPSAAGVRARLVPHALISSRARTQVDRERSSGSGPGFRI